METPDSVPIVSVLALASYIFTKSLSTNELPARITDPPLVPPTTLAKGKFWVVPTSVYPEPARASKVMISEEAPGTSEIGVGV